MNENTVRILVDLRQDLLLKFNRLKDYKNNTNAIMKEVEHAKILHETIQKIDSILKGHVNFSDKK